LEFLKKALAKPNEMRIMRASCRGGGRGGGKKGGEAGRIERERKKGVDRALWMSRMRAPFDGAKEKEAEKR